MSATPHIQALDRVIESETPEKWGEVIQVAGDDYIPSLTPSIKVKRHVSVSKAQARQYKMTSQLPRGVILVEWPECVQLIAQRRVKVVVRNFELGDIVARPNATMTGVVVNTLPICRLQGLSDVVQPNGKTLLCTRRQEGFTRIRASLGDSKLITGVPAGELKSTRELRHGAVVVYTGWVGVVLGLTSAFSLRLTNNTVVEVQDLHIDEEIDYSKRLPEVGDLIVTTKGVLRRGKWIYGAYDANIAPRGAVVHIRTTTVDVEWVRMNSESSTSSPPPVLERTELESSDFVVYDALSTLPSSAKSGEPGRVSYPHFDIIECGRVRFIDQAHALSTYGNGYTKYERADHLGYDMNVFDVVDLSMKVDVLWQDSTMGQYDSPELMTYDPADDVHSAWPGEIAHSVEVEDLPGDEGVTVPKKVGVIQSVDPDQRIAEIRWCPNAHLQLITIDAEGQPEIEKEVINVTVGKAFGDLEAVSLYDIDLPGSLNVCRGNIVMIEKPANCGLRDIKGINWLGTIVEDRLDGALTIRLGAAKPVQDVTLLREQVVVVLRSPSIRGEGWHSSDDLAFDSDATGSMELDDDLGHDDFEEREPTYEDENGQSMNIDEVLDDDWESIEENDENLDEHFTEPGLALHDVHKLERHGSLDTEQTDLHMADLHDEHAADQHDDHTGDQYNTPTANNHDEHDKQHDMSAAIDNVSHTTGNRGEPVAELKGEVHTTGPDTQEAPPSYLLHDSAVPGDHSFSTFPASTSSIRMRQIQKEHGIFQKQGAIPDGVYVRSWETRPDLWRVLFIGPQETPYADAPFIVDFYLPTDYPQSPPQAFFHSWNGESSLAAVGKVNPNLYEDGKICLSLLGTWEGNAHESWNPRNSTLLQVVVSLLGLVLVREPYFNEAGYEDQVGTEEARRPSILYTERVVLRSLNFAISATAALQTGKSLAGMEALEDVLHWLYLDVVHGAELLAKLRRRVQMVLGVSAAAGVDFDGLTSMSQGACISLRRVLVRLDQLISNL